MKVYSFIFCAFLFLQSVFTFEINILKPNYRLLDTNISNDISDIIYNATKEITDYTIDITTNDVIYNFGSEIHKELVKLFNLIDDNAIKCIDDHKIKVNYSLLTVYNDKLKKFNNKTPIYKISDKYDMLSKRDKGDCAAAGMTAAALTGILINPALGGLLLMIHETACIFI